MTVEVEQEQLRSVEVNQGLKVAVVCEGGTLLEAPVVHCLEFV